MAKLGNFCAHWPLPIALFLSAFVFVAIAAEDVTLPDWLIDVFVEAPESPPEPPTPVPAPESKHAVPYAPVPGRDDRTPIEYVSHVFELDDPALPQKMSGIGPVFWVTGGRGTGAMITPTVVLSTAHLFAKDGKWKGPTGLTHKQPSPNGARIWIDICGRSYDFKSIEVGSMAPRSNLGLDYAIGVLNEPVCSEATILPVSLGPDDIGAGGSDQIFIDAGFYSVTEVVRYAQHPLFLDRPILPEGMQRYALFGTRCEATHNRAEQAAPTGSTGLIISKGCFGRPGSSGGPAVLSRDGGATYSIVGVSNSYSKRDPEFNNFTRVEGALASHIAKFVDLVEMPALPSDRSAPSHIVPEEPLGPWDETKSQEERK
ncbi:MAG: hypothetical protein AAGB07_00720 [Pseudomonadota bacterium]